MFQYKICVVRNNSVGIFQFKKFSQYLHKSVFGIKKTIASLDVPVHNFQPVRILQNAIFSYFGYSSTKYR
jgi:hypothetical protein